MRRAFSTSLVAFCFCLATGTFLGCSNNNTNNGIDQGIGDLAGDASANQDGSNCLFTGKTCSTSSQCCSGSCDPTMHVCMLAQCGMGGAPCGTAADCCGTACVGGTCSTNMKCVSDNQACTSSGECCSTICGSNGMCTPLNTQCKTTGNACSNGTECCNQTCTNGQCAPTTSVSYCTQVGDLCTKNADCCTDVCTIASGAAAGTCAQLPSASCTLDGELCSGCGVCCSHFCGPFNNGPAICQPASGCRVQGDLCTQDSDCCGGDPNAMLPGSGLIKCVKDPMYPQIGTCGTPMASNCPPNDPSCSNSCDPEGNVCHMTTTPVCQGGTTNVRNDCCACISGKECCKPDAVGIPRCNALTTCVMPGGTCAFSGDCCNGLPCVPDQSGTLRCGAGCMMTGNTCTTNADCCNGLQCVTPPGSLQGTCGGVIPPPVDGGAPDGPAPICLSYGQACTAGGTPCCNSIQCSNMQGTACTASDASCACFQVIP